MTEVIKNVDFSKYEISEGLINQVLMRTTPLEDWLKHNFLSDRLSGTLKKNARLGFKYKGQLYAEALAQTLGWGFEACPESLLTLGVPVTEGDTHAITEAGWHIDRMLSTNVFSEDSFELKYICVHNKETGSSREGIGVVVKTSSVSWVRKGDIVFSIVSEYNVNKGVWEQPVNPF